ncbi:MAG: S8 family serine peptidase [Phycisphaeraceae bacterium]
MLRRGLVLAVLLLLTAAPSFASDLAFNDPLHEQQWYLRAMRFDAAWARLQAEAATHPPVTVAVIDSGVDLDHPDLTQNMLRGHNIVDGSDDISPLTAHGTGTTGPIGAISNNALGISQAAWTSRVLPIRVTNRPDGRARTADINAAIRYAADQGARVINVSYGGVQLDSVNEAGRYAQQRGAVVIMPAGNEGQHQEHWKRQPNVFAVAAVLPDGQTASFSNHGPFIDFHAPGHGVTSLYPGKGYARWNGTSFASPLVASAAALVLTANPDLAPGQVYAILRRAAADDQRHADTPPRVIDADRAVALALASRDDHEFAPGRDTMERIARGPAGATSADDALTQTPAAAAEADLLQEPQGYIVDHLPRR